MNSRKPNDRPEFQPEVSPVDLEKLVGGTKPAGLSEIVVTKRQDSSSPGLWL